MPAMRAKMQITSITLTEGCEILTMCAVPKKGTYPNSGADEDNTYARFSPYGKLELHVANPALHGQFKPGQFYYLDFNPADPTA